MFVPNPEWLAAGADAVIAAETGVAMLGKKAKDETPAAPSAVATPAPAVVVRTPSLGEWLVFAGLALLAMAMLASALILHHGLTA